MKISDLFSTCILNLLRRKVRTILTIIGVIIGTCSIVVMISLGVGLNEAQQAALSQMGDLTLINIYNYNNGGVVAIGGNGEGEVRQGKNRAAHRRSIGIEQLRPQGQGTDRGAGLGLLDENAGCLGSVAIPGKTGADIVKCRHRGSFLLEIRIFQWTAGPG